jgi:hypothetical protein
MNAPVKYPDVKTATQSKEVQMSCDQTYSAGLRLEQSSEYQKSEHTKIPDLQRNEPSVYENIPERISPEMYALRNELSMYQQLLSLVKSCYKIPSERLDERKKLIIPRSLLRRFVAHLLNTHSDNVYITLIADVGCTLCSNNVHTIEDIKIKVGERTFRSLKIFYNEIYNRISEEFCISLSKAISI